MDFEAIKDKYKCYMSEKNKEKDPKDNYLHAYDFCRAAFKKYYEKVLSGASLDDDDRENFALNLYCYLASWGMVRRKSLLSQKSYHFLIPLCDILFDPDYKELWNIDPLSEDFKREKDRKVDMICCMAKRIKTYFSASDQASITLCGKIIMGTYGCALGYDTNVNRAFPELGYKRHYSFRLAIEETCRLISENEKLLGEAKKGMEEYIDSNTNKPVDYTVFKILDMILWEYGKTLGGSEETGTE